MKENELHSTDAEHLRELITWHEEMAKGEAGGEGGCGGDDEGNSDGKEGHEGESKGGREIEG